MRRVYRLLSVVFNVNFLLLVSSCGIQENTQGPAMLGQMAPVFSYRDSTGKEFSLADSRGKVVLINFWATWCPPCRDEMPSMESLQRHFSPDQFAILALSVDDSWETVNQFMKQQGFTLPAYADFDKKISTLYGTAKFPETYILSKKGIVADKVIGPTDWSAPQMLAHLRGLVAENS